MKIILFGATGMIGSGALIECLDHPDVDEVLLVGRRPSGFAGRPNVTEVVHDDFEDYSAVQDRLRGYDACFFCLGVSAAGMSEADYTRVTYSFAMAAARAVRAANPDIAFCYISGQGADSSESSRVMWARVRGRLENELIALGGPVWIFRPGFVRPTKGVRSRTRLYQTLYTVLTPLTPLLSRIPGFATSTENLGLALIRVARDGADGNHFENRRIEALAGAEQAR